MQTALFARRPCQVQVIGATSGHTRGMKMQLRLRGERLLRKLPIRAQWQAGPLQQDQDLAGLERKGNR